MRILAMFVQYMYVGTYHKVEYRTTGSDCPVQRSANCIYYVFVSPSENACVFLFYSLTYLYLDIPKYILYIGTWYLGEYLSSLAASTYLYISTYLQKIICDQ